MPRINQLTPKMIKFCESIVSGKMPVDAYKSAYNADNMTEQVIRNEANKLMKRNDITEYINTIRQPLQNYFINTGISESERIKNELWSMINNPDTKDENRLRAMDILNRMNKAYSDATTDQKQENELTNIDSTQLMELIKVS